MKPNTKLTTSYKLEFSHLLKVVTNLSDLLKGCDKLGRSTTKLSQASQGHYSAFWKLGFGGDKVVEFVVFVTFYLYVTTNKK